MKHVFVLAGMAVAATTPAFAQGSVTLSGVADAAARSVSNQGAGSVKSLVSGSNATSRLIFRGSEDLGGGLSASFHLEHGLAIDTGLPTAGGFWDRRSTVSLASRAVGELRLGRDFVPSYVGWSRFDPFGYVGVAGSNNLVSSTPVGPIRGAFGTAANTTVRSSNAVQVFLPGGLGGLEGQAMVAAGVSEIKASIVQANLAGRVGATVIDANDAQQIGLGYVYNLSKRTALYTAAARIDNDGAATFVIPGGPAGLAGGRSSTGYEAGVRHIF